MKRKIVVLFLCTLILASLVSCGKEPSGEPQVAPLPEWSPQTFTDDPEKENLRRERKERLTNLPLADESDFSIESVNSGVKITAYNGSGTAFRVPDSIGGRAVTVIGDGVFANRTDLTAVAVPASVVAFGADVFKGCDRLELLSVPLVDSAAHFFGYLFGADSCKNNARDVPESLKLVSVCGTPDTVGEYVFYDCNDLVCVVLPDSVKTVGKFAFCNCYQLEEINLNSLTSVGENAFCNCRSLEKLVFGTELKTLGYASLEGCSEIRSLTVPFVGGSATENTFLGYVFGAEYPETAVGYYPSKLIEITLLEECKILGNNAFYKMKNLQSVSLPEGLTEIGIRAFDGCIHLTGLVIPSSVTVIRENAFFGCLYLGSVTFKEGSELCQIGMNAFYNCRSLKEIVLPDGLHALPNSCFAGCDGLETVNFGEVKTVGKNAFRGCCSIRTVIGEGISFDDGNDTIKERQPQ